MTYASRTEVPVDRSRAEIERIVARYGATDFAYYAGEDRAAIMFSAKDRRIRFDVPLPAKVATKRDQTIRSRWRALALCIKARLEAVEAGIETFEEAFLAHVVMPDGQTVGTHVRPAIAAAYKTGNVPPLLTHGK